MNAAAPTDEIVEELVEIPAGAERLRGVLTYPARRPPRAQVVLASPHPALGGNMDNNVILALARGLASQGIVTLRFDYPGVGKSAGMLGVQTRASVPQIIGIMRRIERFEAEAENKTVDAHDLDGLRSAMRFLRQSVARLLPFYLIGYSYGALLALLLERSTPALVRIDRVILISPPLNRFNSGMAIQPARYCHWILAENDLEVDAGFVQHQIFPSSNRPLVIPGSDHFYINCESKLTQAILELISD